MSDDAVLLHIAHLSKTYTEHSVYTQVLRDVSLQVHVGESIAIIGASGSGKSTLLHLLAGLDTPTSGIVTCDGQPLTAMSDRRRTLLRRRWFGFVYQFHHLLDAFDVLNNVALPLVLQGVSWRQARHSALLCLDEVGLRERARYHPAHLSGGERQRAAIARALVHKPRCIIADEPTGNLDHRNAQRVLTLMRQLQEARDTALIIATHDHIVAALCHKVYILVDGVLAPYQQDITQHLPTLR